MIRPFSFGDEPTNAGESVQVHCHVPKGDKPIVISWVFANSTSEVGEFETGSFGSSTSVLSIASVNQAHSGRYTCVATNRAGSTYSSADLFVNGKGRGS